MEVDTRAARPVRQPQIVVDEQAQLITTAFRQFLLEFSSTGGEPRDYVKRINDMKSSLSTALYVDFAHVAQYNRDLAAAIESEYYRFDPALRIAVQQVVLELHPDYAQPAHRPLLDFTVHFYNTPTVYRLRELKTNKIGKLVAVCGTVTRTSEVRPELLYATFQCLDCQARIENVEQHFKYTEPMKCKNALCQNMSRWQLDPEGSKFVDWQKIRVQENANEIPPGAMPRTLEIVLRHDAVEKAKAGDRCIFVGTLIVVPDVSALKLPGVVQSVRETPKGHKDVSEGEGVGGLKALGVRELTYKLCFLASSVQLANVDMGTLNVREEDDVDMQQINTEFTQEDLLEIYQMKQDPKLYQRLVASIAPTIYGHEEVKKGLLLMLFGGVHKTTPEKINLRGDINICIVGDPSVAKSQFLKYIVGLVPRSIYTAGKASSAAGLTATIVKDVETGDFNIEAGALMLADNGICCIDEFDKMDYADQVAIHEAMEQQTISIAKAGIHATLNARTSILAAANPIGGRYNKTKSLKANLTISSAILSRFDLLYVVLDKQDVDIDESVARYIVNIHQKHEQAIAPPYSTKQLQKYIRFGRTIKPKITESAKQKLIEEYVKLRLSDQGKGKTVWRITVRQLESMIRLSEALARAHLDKEVGVVYVEEAARLLRQSIVNIRMDEVEMVMPETAGSALILPDQINNNIDDDDNNNNNNNENIEKQDDILIPTMPIASLNIDQEQITKSQTDYRKIKISKEKFDKIAQILILHLKQLEQLNPTNKSIIQKDLIKWYLDQIVDEIKSEQDLIYYQNIVRAIINRLINKEKIILVVPGSSKIKDERLLELSPDYELQEDEQLYL